MQRRRPPHLCSELRSPDVYSDSSEELGGLIRSSDTYSSVRFGSHHLFVTNSWTVIHCDVHD